MRSKYIFFVVIFSLAGTLTLGASENNPPKRRTLLRATSGHLAVLPSGKIVVRTRKYSEEETDEFLKERRAHLSRNPDDKSKTPSPLSSTTPVERDVTQWEMDDNRGMKRAQSDSFGPRPRFSQSEQEESEVCESTSTSSLNTEEKETTCCQGVKAACLSLARLLKIIKKD